MESYDFDTHIGTRENIKKSLLEASKAEVNSFSKDFMNRINTSFSNLSAAGGRPRQVGLAVPNVLQPSQLRELELNWQPLSGQQSGRKPGARLRAGKPAQVSEGGSTRPGETAPGWPPGRVSLGPLLWA